MQRPIRACSLPLNPSIYYRFRPHSSQRFIPANVASANLSLHIDEKKSYMFTYPVMSVYIWNKK
jgi:hypothetical protein